MSKPTKDADALRIHMENVMRVLRIAEEELAFARVAIADAAWRLDAAREEVINNER